MSSARAERHGIERQVVAYGGRETYVLDFSRQVHSEFSKWWYYHDKQTWDTLSWMGVKVWKYPTDLWIYQEIVFELQPDLIIETGTAFGGSALYLAHLCDILEQGHVLTIDIEAREDRPKHDRITYVTGSSTDMASWQTEAIETVLALLTKAEIDRPDRKTLTILDSDHAAHHVRKELELYAPRSDYLIVEDTNLNGHPVRPKFGLGPYEAVNAFLASAAGAEWERDPARERLVLTSNPGGYLRRKR
ncbi:MAG: CmcI family methyltransferase [Solirubrobacterales bacterium]